MIATFDIGGTSLKYGVLSHEKNEPKFILQKEIEYEAKIIGGLGIYHKLINIIEELKSIYEIKGIAISTAGMVNADTGVIVYANENIPNYTGMKLKENIEAHFKIPCWVENDVNCAALGEAKYGAGRGMQSSFMLTIGTGIGGAIVINYEVYRGFSDSAGEIGYMYVDNQEFQDLASTTALINNVKKETKEKELNGRQIFERAKKNDNVCCQEIDRLCSTIMKGICNCVYLINPEVVVLGGGIMSQTEILSPIMMKYMNEYMRESVRNQTRLAFAQLGNTAGMIGAYVYFMSKERNNVCIM